MSESFWSTISWGALITGAIGGLLSGTLVPALLQHYRWSREQKEQKKMLKQVNVYDPIVENRIATTLNEIDNLDLLTLEEVHIKVEMWRVILKRAVVSGSLERKLYNKILHKIKKSGY